MSLHQKDSGTRVTAANLTDVTDVPTDDDPMLVVTEDLVQRREYPNGGTSDATAATADDYQTKAFRAGQRIRRSELLAMLTAATVTGVAPATGGTGGNTNVTITGTGLDGVTGVTFGGTAATAVTVVDPRTVTCTTPAHAAGAVAVVVTDDAGAVTRPNGFTYA
jgi:xanthine/CO dehydrogenase XdhC/CoxF family maturation factor